MAIQINKIESAIMEFPNGINVPVEKYINLPFTWEPVLDETHGTAKIIMTDMRQSDFDQYGVRIDKPFDAGTPIEIKFEGQHTLIRMIVARDTAEMARKDGFATWSHNIEMVDEVKKLEQTPVDNLAFRNLIPRHYDRNFIAKWSSYQDEFAREYTPAEIKELYDKGNNLTLAYNENSFNDTPEHVSITDQDITYEIEEIKIQVLFPSGNTQEFLYSEGNNPFFELNEDGEYKIVYTFVYGKHTTAPFEGGIYTPYKQYTILFETYIAVASEQTLDSYTIKSVINRVLDVTPTRTISERNKYTFRNNAEEYATEESPEFTFTGKHLFEVMLDIASYKKMFPALYKNEIYFRPFWNGIMLTSADLPAPTKVVLNSAIDQYCTAVDSYVENMVCVNDTNVGTVVEPYPYGYISARSNSGSEISEDTAIIPTQSAIYQSIKLNIGETDDVVVGDIHAYVYEQEYYEALSDTSAAYPYSKGYAIKYTLFEKNYTELAHRIEADSDIAKALTYPALANIVDSVSGGDVGTDLKDYINGLLGVDNGYSFADLLFQPTYIPVVNARVRQYKPMTKLLSGTGEDEYDATLFYNQQAEVVDSEAFGEHIKGLVQKLGNHTEIRVYRFERVDDVPTVGTLIDEMSVYDTAMTIYENHVDATICLVDYAELSTFIGVKNEIKTSDISSTKWCNRFINWEEFLIFTHNAFKGSSLSITNDALADIVTFSDSAPAEPLTCAMCTTYTNTVPIKTFFLPIKHLAIGNSIYFQWEMLDNFAVGYKSEEAPRGAKNALTGTQYNRAQRAVRYCDVYGRAQTMDFSLFKYGPTINNSKWRVSVDVSITISGSAVSTNATVELSDERPYYIAVQILGKTATTEFGSLIIFSPGETSKEFRLPYNDAKIEIQDVYMYTGTDVAKDTANSYFVREIAHAYPEKPAELVFPKDQYALNESFKVDKLLIEKNSAEALKFAAQYHFRQNWKEFIIGSGMSNFCSLVGGKAIDVALFTSTKPLNRFERHVNLNDSSISIYSGSLPTFYVNESMNRVEISLPDIINFPSTNKAWGFAGKDRNGNWQLIFGENKNANGDPFKLKIYIIPKRKTV